MKLVPAEPSSYLNKTKHTLMAAKRSQVADLPVDAIFQKVLKVATAENDDVTPKTTP